MYNRDQEDGERLRTLAADLAKRVAELADVAGELAAVDPEDRRTARCAYVAGLLHTVQDVAQCAVAYDRAAGMDWGEVGEWLELHPDSARKRYSLGGQRG